MTSAEQTYTNKRWIYAQRPEGEVSEAHYRLESESLSTRLSENEVLIANHYISVDPYMRIQQAASGSWEAPHPLNTLQQAGVVGKVVASNSDRYQCGDWVTAYTGWELFSRVHHNDIAKLDPELAPVTTALGVMGMPGRTAWFGLNEAGRPRPGETVVVSGAAGAVGSLVVQFAKKAGCRVVAIAGSEEKGRWLTQTLGADHFFNYRDFDSSDVLNQAMREQVGGVDVYFDNIGGWITDAVIPLINRRARVIICGQMSQYNGQLDAPEMGPRFLHHMLYQRATIQGILARDFSARMDEMLPIVAPWVRSGELVFEETIVDGFERLPATLAGLFSSNNRGKVLVRVTHGEEGSAA